MIIKPQGIICVTCKQPLGWDSRALMWGTVHQAPGLEYIQTYTTDQRGDSHDHWPMPASGDLETAS
jgi:hypothetical protein